MSRRRLCLATASLVAILACGASAATAAPLAVCELYTDKTAVPTVVTLGEEVHVTLTLEGHCPPSSEPVQADIVLALDRSASQRDNNTWEPTKQAAIAFLERIDFSRHQVAVLTFGAGLPLVRPDIEFHHRLSQDGAAVKAALAAIPPPPAVTLATNITAAIEAAQQELTSIRHRTIARPVLVLLSDGAHNAPGTEPPLAAADRAKTAGTLIVTIGLAVDETATRTLRGIASRPNLYFPAPTAAELEGILVEIAGRVVAGGLSSLRIVDILPPEVELVAGSIDPPPSAIERNTISWDVSSLPPEGWMARYRIKPLVVGSYNANKVAYVDYVDADGSVGSRPFPLPLLTVRSAPPSTLTRILLPALLRGYCRTPQAADVVLVMDTSSSMWGEKLARAREAAREFVRLLQLPPSQAAVVAFNSSAGLVQGLTTDQTAVLAALDRLPRAEGSRLDLGLATAVDELARPRSPRNPIAAVILLTDGRQVGAPETAVLDAAAAARRAGIIVFTIGIGDDVDGQLLTLVAGTPERYFAAPTAAQLVGIYRDIAGDLPCLGSP